MAQRFKNRGNRGFSLVETLAVVAILVILLSISAVAAAYYRDYLKITELDNAAREIYMAAENRAVLLNSGDQMDTALTGGQVITLSEGGDPSDSVKRTYVTYEGPDGTALGDLLTFGAIDPALLDGQFHIVYDQASGAVTDVFYTEGPEDIQDIDHAFSIAGNRDARMRETPMLGYYGGEQTARENYTPLSAPEVMVVVENGDLLTVDVTFSLPDSTLSVVGNNWIHDAKQTVELSYNGKTVTLLSIPGASSVVRPPAVRSISDSSITYTWVLDALDTSSMEDRHFWQLFKDKNMPYGGNFTVTAGIELSAPGRRPASASGSDTGNSLFAEHSGGGSARLENLRHLQNLDTETSCAAGMTSAIQLADIDCCGKQPRAPYDLYEFKPIVNKELRSFDGGWTVEGGSNRRNEITGLLVTEGSAEGKLGAGLFAQTNEGGSADKPVTFTGVRLIDAVVSASVPSGALAGMSGNNVQFKDIQVVNAQVTGKEAAGGVVGNSTHHGGTALYATKFQDIRVINTRVSCANGAAGGVAGKAHGVIDYDSTNYIFDNCWVYWEPEEGQQDLLSLLGSNDPGSELVDYAITGKHAGGFVGEITRAYTIWSDLSNCVASTTIHGTSSTGGFVGESGSLIQIESSYTDCYLAGGYAAGLVGNVRHGSSVTLIDSYTAGFIDMSKTQKAAGFCLGNAEENSFPKIETENSYAAVYYPRQEDGKDYTGSIYQLTELQSQENNDTFSNTYYLAVDYGHEKPAESVGGAYGGTGFPDETYWGKQISYSELTDAKFPGKLGGAFGKKTESTTFPYNLQENMKLEVYEFPGLKNLPHYGDWGAEFSKPSLVYYELYENGKYGFSGGNARYLSDEQRVTIGELDNLTIRSDGYAVAFLADQIKEGECEITYTYLDNSDPKKLQLLSEEYAYTVDNPEYPLIPVEWGEDEYYLAPLPDKLVIGDLTSPDFFQYLRFEASSEDLSASGESFYNPHFAEAVIPYVSADGSPFLKSGIAPNDAAALISSYVSDELIAKRTRGAVSIRTPRHFYDLSNYSDYYSNTKHHLTFQQERSLDGHESVYTGYRDKNLLRYETGANSRGFQLQSPIGTQAASFLGTYNGNCFVIRRVAFEIPLNDKNRVCAGLFGSSGGTLQNIVYSLNPLESGESEQQNSPRSIVFYSNERETFLGALAGFNTLTGKILNCAVEGVNLTTQVNTSDIYIGGLCGENAGLIQGSAAESAYLHVDASNYALAYVGGLTGRNRGQIDTSYAVGRLAAEAAQENAPATLAGFAGLNSGSISNSYSAMDLRPDGARAEAYGFSGPSSGGRQSGTCYLNNGNFSYRGEAFLAKYEEGGSAQPRTYVELTAADAVSGMEKMSVPSGQKAEDFFPYPTGVKKGTAPWHYGDWPKALELGTMGVYYWEELQIPGKPISYHVSLLAVDPGENADAPKTISKSSTLSTAHDQGGEVIRYGYGIYNKQGITASLKDDTPFPLLYSVDGGEGGSFHELYSGLEEAKKNAQSSSNTQAYLDRQVDEALARLMTYELDKEGKTQFEFHSFHSFGLQGDTLGGLYPNASTTTPNGTLTLVQGGNQQVEVTFALNPLFAGALAVEKPQGSWTADEDVPTFTRGDGGQDGQTGWSNAPGGSKDRPYGVRSIGQLQMIDWNNMNRDVSTVISNEDGSNGRIKTADTFPYLNSRTQEKKYYWSQTYDLLGERDGAGNYKTYTPIAEYYDRSGGPEGTLTGWFGGVYEGGGYMIENVNIEGQVSSCAGLFGVVFNGTLKDVVLYSSDGKGKISTVVGDEHSESRWFYMGALAGAAGTSDPDGNAIQNCSVAGYSIEATGFTFSQKVNGQWDGWGGNIIGGLVGASHMNLSGCSAVVNVNVHDARENDNMRVGGLVGSCQRSITNCYAGGSISIGENVTLIRNDRGGIFVGGLVGGSYMKPLNIDGTTYRIGTIGEGTESSKNETNNALTNCYSFVTLPSLDCHTNLHGLYAIGGTGEIYDGKYTANNEARKANNHGVCTITNCYYLADEVMANNPGKNGKSSEWTIIDTLENKKATAPDGTDWAVDARKTDVGTVTSGSTVTYRSPSPDQETVDAQNGKNPWRDDKFNSCTVNKTTYYHKGDFVQGTPLYTRMESSNGKQRTYTFVGWYDGTGLRDKSKGEGTVTTSGGYTPNPNVTGLTYEELAGMTGVQAKDNQNIYDLLPGEFSRVTTTTKDGVSIPGKYSYPTEKHPELRDRDYPFPTVLTKDAEGYHVHYGDWPLKGFRRQTLFNEDGSYSLLGGSPIGIDLFVNGMEPHEEYLVLTDGVGAGGTWSFQWESANKAEDEIAETDLSERLSEDQITNAAEKSKAYYLFKLTPKKDGSDILQITYTVGGVPYTLRVTVHITAVAELRPNRLFMFPNDTVDVTVKATNKEGLPLDGRVTGGELTLKGNPHCESSGYLTAQTLRAQATEGGQPTIRFKTAVPEGAAELEKGLGANADFAYTVTTPDPDDPSKTTKQNYGGGTGGDIRVEIIRPWKDEENRFVRFTEEGSQDDGTARVVCTISFPDSYEVEEEGILQFERSGALSVAPMPQNQPDAEWIEEAGRITLKLTYQGVKLPEGVPETTVSIPLKLTSKEGQLVEGGQIHTLTLTVGRPADTQADTQGTQSIDALPPGEDGQDSSVRRRRWKRKHQRRRPVEHKS